MEKASARWWNALERRAARLAAALALVTFAGALWWGSFIAGGSDSYCYIAQAASLATGRLTIDQPLARSAPWPNAIETLTPGGYRPSSLVGDAIVPICPPGLSLTIAPFWRVLGSASLEFVFPLFGALAVWLTFVVGRRVQDGRAGLMAATLLAASPIFLYQVVQPMSDVPATTWWLAATALALRAGATAATAAGLATSMAVLTRPNLAPLVPVVAALVWVSSRASLQACLGVSARRPWKPLVAYVLAVLPGCLAIAAIQASLYGSPLASGYGTATDYFAADRMPINLRHYLTWLVDTHTALVSLAVVAPVLVSLQARRAAAGEASLKACATVLWLFLGFFAVTLACYLPYLVFEEWWYLRFLLPGLPHVLVLLSIAVILTIGRFPAAVRAVALVAVTTALGAAFVHTARDRSAFRLYDLERRFRDAGQYVAAHVSPRAIVVTSWHSGSVRQYAGRPTVLWDALDPEWLDIALDFMRENAYVPLFLFEAWEEPEFRARFEGRSAIGGLDWPPIARIGREVRIYDPADRPRYLAGEVIRTEQTWPR